MPNHLCGGGRTIRRDAADSERPAPTRRHRGAARRAHHSAVITGIARAGIDALIELAVQKTPRGRTGGLCEKLWNTVAAGEDTMLEQRARCRLAAVYAAAEQFDPRVNRRVVPVRHLAPRGQRSYNRPPHERW